MLQNRLASEYLKNRKINPDKFYYSEDFSAFIKSFKVDYDGLYKERRIIIPLYYENNLIGFQGRSFGSKINKVYHYNVK